MGGAGGVDHTMHPLGVGRGRGRPAATTASQTATFGETQEQELTQAGSQQLSFGQYAGLTFEDVLERDPGYCAWAVAQANPSSVLAQFASYVRRAQGRSSASSGSAAAEAAAAATATPAASSSSTPLQENADMDAVRAARLARFGGG